MVADLKSRCVLAYPVGDAPAIAGVSRTRVFAAIRDGEMIARKAGRRTIIEAHELQRWIRSLPMRGRARKCPEYRDGA